MYTLTKWVLALACVCTLAGCATGKTLGFREPTGPLLFSGLDRSEFYSGHQLNMAAIRGDGRALGWFYSRGIVPPEYPVLDLVPSLAADTLIAPIVLLTKVDDSIDAFVDVQFERHPALRLTYEVPVYVMTAPFVAAISVQEYVGTQIAEFKAARAGTQ